MAEQLVDENTFFLYKEGMASMRETLGRRIIVKLPSIVQDCPNCSWDDVNQRSSGMYDPIYPYPASIPGPKSFKGRCPVCKGKGKVAYSEQSKRIKGQCTWLEGKARTVTVGGKTYDTDIKASNIDIRFYDIVEKADSFIVDGQEVDLAFKPLKEGLRDLIKFTAYFTHSKLST